MNDYKTLMKLYIEARDYKDFHQTIMQEAIHRLYDPNERIDDWTFLSEKGLDQVKRWLMFNELKKFFDNDSNSKRFDYWKRYFDYMENVIPLKTPLVAFIYFENFVVVEFGKIGAAYIYYKEGFEKYILTQLKNSFFKYAGESKKESLLKRTESFIGNDKLFIDKYHHQGNWQERFDKRMSRLLH